MCGGHSEYAGREPVDGSRMSAPKSGMVREVITTLVIVWRWYQRATDVFTLGATLFKVRSVSATPDSDRHWRKIKVLIADA